MKYFLATFLTMFFFLNKIIGQDFSVELNLNKGIPDVYKKAYLPHIVNDTKTLDKFLYDKKTRDNISFFYYVIPSTNIKNELVTDTINAIVYIYPHETRLIIDENKDDNFRNDKIYLFNSSNSYYEADLAIQIDKYIESNLDKKRFLIYPSKEKDEFIITHSTTENETPTFTLSNKRNEPSPKLERFKIVKNWIYEGNFKFNDKIGNIYLQKEYSHDTTRSVFVFDIEVTRKSFAHRIGDTVLIEGQLYATGGDQNRLHFKYIRPINYDIFPSVNYLNKKQLKEENFRGKYLLLDFWGSWCHPCIKGIPDLKKLQKKYNQNLQIISLAYENSTDMSALDRILKEQEMDWPQIAYVRSNKDSSLNGEKFKIQVFPTFVLIDPQGRTIMRTETLEGLDPIDGYMQQQFKK